MTQTSTNRREEVIQWAFRTSRSNVPIVGLPSLSALRSKSSSNPEAIPTSLSAVPHAAKQGRQNVTEIVATVTGHDAKCSPQYALSVAKTPKYRSSPAKVDRCIAVSATVRSNWANNTSLTFKDICGEVVKSGLPLHTLLFLELSDSLVQHI